MTCLLSQAELAIPLSDTMKTLVGLIGIMTLGITVLTFVILVKKVFGAKPPMDKQIEKIRREIYEVNGRTKKAVDKEIATLESKLTAALEIERKRITQLDEFYREMQMDRERKWNELKSEYNDLNVTLAFIRGKFERKKKGKQEDSR